MKVAKFIFALGVFSSLGAISKAESPLYDGVALVVSNQVITYNEIRQRMVLLATNLGLDPNQAVDRLRQQVLRNVVAEKLRVIHAVRNGIAVSPAEMENAIAQYEERIQLQRGDFLKQVARLGVSEEVARDQIRARLLWQKYVSFNLSPRITIRPEEVEARLEAANSRIGTPEYDYGEIFIPFEGDRDIARRFIERLAEIIKQEESSEARLSRFSLIARQYSRSASAGRGGDMGWGVGSTLAPAKAKALEQTALNSLSEVVETPSGFYLLFLKNSQVVGKKGEDRFTLVQFSGDGQASQILEAVKADACGKVPSGLEAKEFKRLTLPALAPAIGNALTDQLSHQRMDKEGTDKAGTDKAGTDMDGVAFIADGKVYKVCDLVRAETVQVSREEIRNQLAQERLDRVVQQTVRALFRNAYVDVRI